MKPLAFEAEPLGQGRVGTVGQVTDTGMAQGCEVHPDLVGAAGLEMDLHQRGRPERLDDLVVGDARLAAGQHRELVVVVGMAADRGVDRALQRIGQALDEGVVGLVDRALLEGTLERGVGVLAFGDHHESTGAHVETVDDAAALLRT